MISSTQLISIILFTTLLSSVSSSGTLQLEFTASKDCYLNITTEVSSVAIHLPFDKMRTVSVHSESETKVRVFKYDVVDVQSRREFGVYTLKVSTKQRIYTFGNVLISVKAAFRCDAGYTGLFCDEQMPSL